MPLPLNLAHKGSINSRLIISLLAFSIIAVIFLSGCLSITSHATYNTTENSKLNESAKSLAYEEINPLELCAYYFYREGCSNCALVEPIIEQLQENYTNFNVTKFDVNVPENSAMLMDFMRAYDIEDDSQPLPIVIIDNQLYAGVKPVVSNLENVIKVHLKGLDCPRIEEKS